MGDRSSGYKNVARVVGKIGKAGEVRVEPIDGLPFLLSEDMVVHLTPPRMTGLRCAKVESVREVGDAYGVKFEGCDTVSQAFELEGRLCLVSCEDIEDYLDEEDLTFLIGMRVEDTRLGYMGEVTDVVENPLQALLVIGDEERPDRYLVPLVDEFVECVDGEVVIIGIPDDLANLNARPEEAGEDSDGDVAGEEAAGEDTGREDAAGEESSFEDSGREDSAGEEAASEDAAGQTGEGPCGS